MSPLVKRWLELEAETDALYNQMRRVTVEQKRLWAEMTFDEEREAYEHRYHGDPYEDRTALLEQP